VSLLDFFHFWLFIRDKSRYCIVEVISIERFNQQYRRRTYEMVSSIQTQTLSDGSQVYDLAVKINSELTARFNCVDEYHAIRLQSDIESCVDINIEGLFSYASHHIRGERP
jgi:hypothetical protein